MTNTLKGLSRRNAIAAAGLLGAAVAAPAAAKVANRRPAPLSLEDRAAIQDLFTDYLWAYDCSDEQGFIDLFSPDGMVVGHGKHHVGEAAMREWFRYLLDMRDKAQDFWLHEAGQFRFEGDGQTCVVYAYATHFRGNPVTMAYPGELTMGVRSLGYFVNECVKIGGKWKFRRLTINRWDLKTQPWKKPKPWDAA
ncbi:MAG: nuclear transport factor 2 family protein [Sphingomonadales bacterium]|nr:nuclear transport factor 2 family protein [Sphingomonadales bacterium]